MVLYMTKYAIRLAKMLDVESKSVKSDVVILVENGVIKDVGKEGEVDTRGYEEIVFDEGYGMPGLIDAHLHLVGVRSDRLIDELFLVPPGLRLVRCVNDAKRLVESGFTTVRDCGSVEALYVRDAIKEGEIVGPRIVAAGYFLTQTFGHGDLLHSVPESWSDYRCSGRGFTLICNGVDECRKAARYALREGADFIKISTSGGVMSQRDLPEYVQFSLDEVKAIVEETEHVGKFVASHAQGTKGINHAIEAGVKTIEHAIYPDGETVKLAREKQPIFIITLSITKLIAERGKEAGYPEWAVRKARKVLEDYIDNIKYMVRNGLKLGLGTDYFGSPLTKMGSNARELTTLVEDVGLKPWQVLEMMWINNAEACGLKGKIGLLKKGYLADIIVCKENPLEDIKVLENVNNIVFVMVNGKIVKRIR